MRSSSMRVAVVFDNFGPYHLARLGALDSLCELHAIEVFARSGEYEWRRPANVRRLRELTLFDAGDAYVFSVRELRRRLVSALGRCSPEVVFVPGWSVEAALLTLEWCGEQGVAAVCMSESQAIDAPRHRLTEWLKRRVVRMFSAAIVGGRRQQSYLESLGMPRHAIFQGYASVDNDYFAHAVTAIRDAGARHRDGKGRFLVVSRFVEKKNLPFVLCAYRRYRDRMDASRAPWDLELLGDGPMRPMLEQLVSDLGIGDSVTMPGFVQYEDLPMHFARADALIHASTVEQWGLVVNEAMASSLPVLVSSCCGCAADLVIDGITGYQFDPRDDEALAALMVRLSSHPDDCSTMGAQARKQVEGWSVQAFAANAMRAAEAAQSRKRAGIGPVDRMLLRGLAAR